MCCFILLGDENGVQKVTINQNMLTALIAYAYWDEKKTDLKDSTCVNKLHSFKIKFYF